MEVSCRMYVTMNKDVEQAVQKAISAVGLDVVKAMSMFSRGRSAQETSRLAA